MKNRVIFKVEICRKIGEPSPARRERLTIDRFIQNVLGKCGFLFFKEKFAAYQFL